MKFQENVNLAQYSNYKIGGPARFFFEADTVDEISWAAAEAKKLGVPLFILGGGTNLLISDEGFPGVVLKPAMKGMEADGEFVRAGAGVDMKDLLEFNASKGLSGLEWAGGLPGTLGGAVRGNAGAFGGEIKDTLVEVESFDLNTGKIIKRNNLDCRFAYRSSIFKEEGNEVILSALFKLKRAKKEDIVRAIEEKINYRLARHPMEYPNVGSVFKNVPVAHIDADTEQVGADRIRVCPRSPHLAAYTALVKTDPFPVIPAAHLITQTGLKGVSFGGAMISPKHANFIVNALNATCADVQNLINLAKSEVENKFGIKLEEEIKILS